MKILIPINIKITLPIIVMLIATIWYIVDYSVGIQTQEKLNQTYQIQLNESRYLSNQFKTYTDNSVNTLRQLASLNWEDFETASKQAKSIIQNQSEVERIYLVEVPTDESEIKTFFRSSNESNKLEEEKIHGGISKNFDFLSENKLSMINLQDNASPYIGVFIGDFNYDKGKVLVLTAVINTEKIFHNNPYQIDIVSNYGDLIYSTNLNSQYSLDLFNQARNSDVTSASKELQDNFNSDLKSLGTFVKLPNGIYFLTTQSMNKVINSIYVTTQKIILIGIIALCITILLTIKISSSIIDPILELTKATKEISKGKFDVKVLHHPNDEIGVLGKNFVMMSKKIKLLLDDQIKKLRIENEMKITATIQQTLFPEKKISGNNFDVFSHTSPATECGGDIWGCFSYKNKLYFIIADATGHGLPSAFITVSAKSTLSFVKRMLEQNHEIGPAEILGYANRTVFETSQGKILMTCFVGVIDFETGVLKYSNAGHNSPWIFSDQNISSLSIPGVRLGEREEENDFKEKEVILKNGDKVFLYTDGITENTNEQGEMFDKKRVRNIISKHIKTNDAESTLGVLIGEFSNFVGKKALDDDTTIVMIDIKNIGVVSENT